MQRKLESYILGRALHQVMLADSSAHRQAYGLIQLKRGDADNCSSLHLISSNRPFSELAVSGLNKAASPEVERSLANMQGKSKHSLCNSADVEVKNIAQHAEDLIAEVSELHKALKAEGKCRVIGSNSSKPSLAHDSRRRFVRTIIENPETLQQNSDSNEHDR